MLGNLLRTSILPLLLSAAACSAGDDTSQPLASGGTGDGGGSGAAPDGGSGGSGGSGGAGTGSTGGTGGGGTAGSGAAGTGGSGGIADGGGTGGTGPAGSGGTGGASGATGTGGSGGSGGSGPLVMGYILEMEVGGVAALDQLNYSSVDYVIHAFVDTNATTAAISGVGSFDAYRQAGIVDKVHAGGARILMSFGGANHSWGMKEVARDAGLTATFASNVVDALNNWGYDGVDIDLEFPWGGNEPQEHLALVTAVYNAVKANNSEHLVLFGVSPGYLISEYVWPQLVNVSDYAFYFCYDWSNPANGPIRNPGQTLSILSGESIEASCRGALDYVLAAGYPASQIIVGLPFYANGGAKWYTAPAGLDAIAPHPDYMEVNSNGYWTTPTAMRMKVGAVTNPAQSVLSGGAVVAGVGWWEWGHEDPADPALSQAINDELGR